MKLISTQDTHVLAKLNKTVHELHVRMYPELFKPYCESTMQVFFENMIKTSKYLFYIVVENEEAIGYVWLEKRYLEETPFKKANAYLYVHQLSLEPHVQNKGFGKLVMKEVEDIAIHLDLHRIELDYWVSNEAAAAFYERCGFVKQRVFVFKDLNE